MLQKIRYTQSGHIFIGPEDDPLAIASLLDNPPYDEEFCIALDFSPGFIARLMGAGFLVMSTLMEGGPGEPEVPVLLPKMHRERAVLFPPDYHESRTIRRLMPRYRLVSSPADLERILEGCVRAHGEDWLTPPLREAFRALPQIIGFSLYRGDHLVAGEFGAVAGKVYTSYSGYYEENSAGSVQLALTGRYLRDAGFALWDLGMPMPYKERLGAQIVDRPGFLELFRQAVPLAVTVCTNVLGCNDGS